MLGAGTYCLPEQLGLKGLIGLMHLFCLYFCPSVFPCVSQSFSLSLCLSLSLPLMCSEFSVVQTFFFVSLSSAFSFSGFSYFCSNFSSSCGCLDFDCNTCCVLYYSCVELFIENMHVIRDKFVKKNNNKKPNYKQFALKSLSLINKVLSHMIR